MTNKLKATRVNVTRLTNTKVARKEKRNGRDVIVIPSATMPDDIIMNGIKYPGKEIEKSYLSLNRSPAPLDHPMVNGKFVSARDPEGINVGWIGAWNENARYENGRVFLDKVIDVQRANESEGGKRVLAAVEKGEPIHTSTGLLAHLEFVKNEEYEALAHNIEFDHDAILLDYEGAATPEQGVGIFVNSSGAAEEIDVINSVWEEADREMDWAVESIARALEKRAKAPLYERLKAAITEAFSAFGAETTTNQEEAEMSKELDELSAKVDALTESMKDIGKTITDGVAQAFTNALKPLVDAQEATLANAKAQEEAEKNGLIDKVVKANLLDEATAKETPLGVLKALTNNIKEPSEAARIRPGMVQNQSEGGVVAKFKAPASKGA